MGQQKMKQNNTLIIGGILSIMASLLHVAIIIGGPDWYRFFGAGEGMAQLAENGSSFPRITTTTIAALLMIWGLYAFSAVGIITKLPFLKPILILISSVYLLRGILGIPIVFYLDHPYLNELKEKMIFMIFSSVISFVCGLFYLIGYNQIRKNKLNQ